MLFDEKRIWKVLAFIGLVITSLSLAVSMFQFFIDTNYDIGFIRKIDRILINLVSFGCFVFLYLNPRSFFCYAFLFYVYGIGNLLDEGSILAAFCIGCSYCFLRAMDFFRKKKKAKTIVFFVPPVVALCCQFFYSEPLTFWMSVMHIAAGIYIALLVFALVYPSLHKARQVKNEKVLERNFYSQRDVDFLSSVLCGEKYKKIATLHNVSESTVKARMIELYKVLDVKDRTEFISMYRGYSFRLG